MEVIIDGKRYYRWDKVIEVLLKEFLGKRLTSSDYVYAYKNVRVVMSDQFKKGQGKTVEEVMELLRNGMEN